MKANYETAAIKAIETLIKYHVTSAPIVPLPILKSIPGVVVMSFAALADKMGIDRQTAVHMFGDENQDATTTVNRSDIGLRYVVAYNQQLPFYMLQRSLARELGHIILRHDGSRPEDVRTEEATCFARHFICPRPLIRALQDANVRITTELIGNMTGCYQRCIAGMKETPATHVPANLNRIVREQFSAYLNNFLDYYPHIQHEDTSAVADLGTFMDGYEE